MTYKEIGDPTYLALETFRKSGEGVVTPVWVTAEAGKLYVWTVGNSGKVKRIHKNGRIRIAASDVRGKPKGDWLEAHARILEEPTEELSQRRRMLSKYGWQFRMITVMGKLRRQQSPHVAVEISPL